MFVTSQKVSHIVGTWKFNRSISHEQLETIAKGWAKDPRYVRLSIRNASKEQYGIDFEFNPTENNQKEFDNYLENTSDYLKRQTGNSLVGWDISSYYYTIK